MKSGILFAGSLALMRCAGLVGLFAPIRGGAEGLKSALPTIMVALLGVAALVLVTSAAQQEQSVLRAMAMDGDPGRVESADECANLSAKTGAQPG